MSRISGFLAFWTHKRPRAQSQQEGVQSPASEPTRDQHTSHNSHRFRHSLQSYVERPIHTTTQLDLHPSTDFEAPQHRSLFRSTQSPSFSPPPDNIELYFKPSSLAFYPIPLDSSIGEQILGLMQSPLFPANRVHPSRSSNLSRSYIQDGQWHLSDFNDLAPVSGSPILSRHMSHAINSPIILDREYMNCLFMYHCWDRKYGTPLPITRQVLPGDVGNFDRSGNFGVFFNIYDSGRGALPLKDPSPPIDCDIQETYIGDSSTRLLNIVLVSHPAHPSNYRLFLKGGSTRFMFLVPDASQKAFKNPSVVREYANAQSALWYKHVASVFGFENMDLVLIESVVESSTRTYFASCPISTSKSNPEAPIILALATGDINMSLHNTENNEDHYLLHQLAPKNSPAGPHVAYVGAIPLPKPSLNR